MYWIYDVELLRVSIGTEYFQSFTWFRIISLGISGRVYHVLIFSENSLVERNLYQLMTKLTIS